MVTNSADMNMFFLYDCTTDWSNQGLLMGQKDIPLNEKGRREAEEVGKALVGHEITSLCFSPLMRSKETAQIIAKHCHCGLYPMEGFKERHWGALEGQIYKQDQLTVSDETLPMGAENKISFTERVRSALAAAGTYPPSTLIVSHEGVLQIICRDLNVDYPDRSQGKCIHFFQRLGRWVAKPVEM
jgi:broad specificity phosphatase PhoE